MKPTTMIFVGWILTLPFSVGMIVHRLASVTQASPGAGSCSALEQWGMLESIGWINFQVVAIEQVESLR